MRLAAALGTALRRGTRVVASRASPDACRMIQRAIIAGLTSTGVDVADLRISPAAVTRHVLKTQGLAAGVHVGVSSVDPEVVQIRVFEWPGNQMTEGLQKEVEKHFSRQELRRGDLRRGRRHDVPGARPGELRAGHPRRDRPRARPRAAVPRRDRLRLLAGDVHAAARPRAARRRGDRRPGLRRRGAGEDELDPLNVRRIVTGVGAELGVVLDRAARAAAPRRRARRAVSPDLGMLLVVQLLARSGRAGQIAVPVTATGLVDEVVAGVVAERRSGRRTP